MVDIIESEQILCASNDVENTPTTWINLTQQASILQQLLLGTSEIDIDKVKFLKEEIATGRYKISNQQIAKKLFADSDSD